MRRDIRKISARTVWKIERDLLNVAHTFSGKNGNNLIRGSIKISEHWGIKKLKGSRKSRDGNYKEVGACWQ